MSTDWAWSATLGLWGEREQLGQGWSDVCDGSVGKAGGDASTREGPRAWRGLVLGRDQDPRDREW